MKVLVTICILATFSMVRTATRCQLDTTTRSLLNNMNPMMRKLGVKLLETKATIVNRWLENNLYESSNVPRVPSLEKLRQMNKSTPMDKLEINRRILKVFIPHINKFVKQFEELSVTRDVTYRLQEIKWTTESIISFVEVIQGALQKQSNHTSTAVARPMGIPSVSATTSSTSSVTAKQASSSGTTLTLRSIALRASSLLDDFISLLLKMRIDFMILSKTLCL
ncbi:uncharacterized protein [Montipora capricornis]|uniref:uncharacterized protein n=1 Tax=Montipora capricornis TaxID=246305 RepID=UPI0035F0FF99